MITEKKICHPTDTYKEKGTTTSVTLIKQTTVELTLIDLKTGKYSCPLFTNNLCEGRTRCWQNMGLYTSVVSQ
jgi:hypothetical protein